MVVERNKHRLSIPIFSNSNIVIAEEFSIEDFTFKPSKEKGVIETTAGDENEKKEKIEKILNLMAFISLTKSEKVESNFFIYSGRPKFFNIKTYGLLPSGQKIDLYLDISEEEMALTYNDIKDNLEKYKIISKDEKLIMALRWYNFGKASLDLSDGFISFLISLETLSFITKENIYTNKDMVEIEKIENCLRKCLDSLKLKNKFKTRIISTIGKLKKLSFKERIEILYDKLSEDVKEKILTEAKNLNLIHKKNKEELFSLIGEIYKDRGAILHEGKTSIKNLIQKYKFLEIFTRKVLVTKIHENFLN